MARSFSAGLIAISFAITLVKLATCVAITADAQLTRRNAGCPDYSEYAQQPHAPYSSGRFRIPDQRPVASCRTFNSSLVENTISRLKSVIADPDLLQVFQNTFPNTLDTTVRWHGHSANDTTEELAFIVTGDIDAMWLRDSTNQLHAYASLLAPSTQNSSLASLFRGTINLQSRYISQQPWCNSFQAPPESGIATNYDGAAYTVSPDTIDLNYCFTPNFELDSYGAFFKLSLDYYSASQDAVFFGRHSWKDAVQQILRVVRLQMEPFYNATTGAALTPAYTFNSQTTTMQGTLGLNGLGNPVKYTGMVKAPFRPSDDSSLFQFLVPSNTMFASYMSEAAKIADGIMTSDTTMLANEMRDLANTIQSAVAKNAIVPHPTQSGKSIYAFEVDGYGGRNLLDDANTPSLLSIPLTPYFRMPNVDSTVYNNTRGFVLSLDNPWWAEGPTITGIGSSHTGIGRPWPMALITRIQTSSDDQEIIGQLKQLVSTTGGLGLMHESINSHNASDWTRQWFAWCNSLFGEMILDLNTRKPHILSVSLQD